MSANSRSTDGDPATITPFTPPPGAAWLSTMGAVIATVHRAAHAEGVPTSVTDELLTVCANGMTGFAGAMPYSLTDCALMSLSLKMCLDEGGLDAEEQQRIFATTLLRIALFLGDKTGDGALIDQLAGFIASGEELAEARGWHSGSPEPTTTKSAGPGSGSG